jgi:large subunit ribosomal protein L3
MPRHSRPRHGSLQFYPRKRANKILPRINWGSIPREGKGLKGFIGYKVGMKSAYVLDNTQHSFTKGKKIVIPITIIECPSIRILSIRFYKNGIVVKEILNENLDKELKRKLTLPKQAEAKKKLENLKEDYEDIRIIVYSQVKKTGIKKSPDIAEIGLSGSKEEKLQFVKDNLNKEISIKEVFKTGVVDFRGVTKGKGLQGQVKRFGLNLKAHKSEKGVRTLGTGGAWHPCRVTFRDPRAGQMGFFTRAIYNNKIIDVSSITEKDINPKEGFKHFGRIKTDYMLVFGSIQGANKRQLLITDPLRLDEKQSKKSYELIELR